MNDKRTTPFAWGLSLTLEQYKSNVTVNTTEHTRRERQKVVYTFFETVQTNLKPAKSNKRVKIFDTSCIFQNIDTPVVFRVCRVQLVLYNRGRVR